MVGDKALARLVGKKNGMGDCDTCHFRRTVGLNIEMSTNNELSLWLIGSQFQDLFMTASFFRLSTFS